MPHTDYIVFSDCGLLWTGAFATTILNALPLLFSQVHGKEYEETMAALFIKFIAILCNFFSCLPDMCIRVISQYKELLRYNRAFVSLGPLLGAVIHLFIGAVSAGFVLPIDTSMYEIFIDWIVYMPDLKQLHKTHTQDP